MKAVNDTVNLSDKIGYIYWFFVLVTISCGCVTGIYMTLKNKHDMTIICQQKYQMYEYFLQINQMNGSTTDDVKILHKLTDNQKTTWNKHVMDKNNDDVVGINELYVRVNHLEKMFKLVVWFTYYLCKELHFSCSFFKAHL